MNSSTFAIVTAFAISTAVVRCQPTISMSSDDLWDTSQGAFVTAQSSLAGCMFNPAAPFDARDIFGGQFGVPCVGFETPGTAIFIDGTPVGYVHYVEWRTLKLVTVRSFNLWGGGDGDASHSREFASFRLLAKTPGSNSFDQVLCTFTPTHPYTWVGGIGGLIISTDIKPTTAQEFRAEFVTRAATFTGPRIYELDGFSEPIGLQASIRVSEVEVSWNASVGFLYQVEYRDDVSSSNWNTLGAPVTGDGGVARVVDVIAPGQPRRLYRVRKL